MVLKEKVKLLKRKNVYGLTIPGDHYTLLSEFILTQIKSKKSGKIFFTELLNRCIQEFNERFKGNAAWWLLKVKQDLELSNVIRVSFTSNLIQFIELKKSKPKNQEDNLSLVFPCKKQ